MVLMTDLERILPLWRELELAGADYVLATVVAVEGSSYRKPGAHMLLSPDGRRAGTVSGGCLEAEVSRRAWWLTADGPVVERFSTIEDDGERPYGSGCGGLVFILLERRATARPLLDALEPAFAARLPLAIATILQGPRIGHRAFAGIANKEHDFPALVALAERSFAQSGPITETVLVDGVELDAWADYRRGRPGLWIFGAGDDAKPLVKLARELGWFVTVADGRSNLATRERFPDADEVRVLPIANLPGVGTALAGIKSTDAAAVMAHSFEQDARVLAALLALDSLPFYIGALGPQRRTRELLVEAARLLGLPGGEKQIERWMELVHAPMGLDLGAEAPAAVAFSVLAEIQQSLNAATGQPLSEVRGARAITEQA